MYAETEVSGAAAISWRRALILLVEEFVVDVRPEFLEGEGGAVETHVQDPALSCLGPGALAGGVVEIGDASGRPGTDDFRGIE